MPEVRTIFDVAREFGRDHVTPEDVGEALSSGCPLHRVRYDVLRAIGGGTGVSVEDAGLCAFVAAQGGDDGTADAITVRLAIAEPLSAKKAQHVRQSLATLRNVAGCGTLTVSVTKANATEVGHALERLANVAKGRA